MRMRLGGDSAVFELAEAVLVPPNRERAKPVSGSVAALK